MLETFCWNHPDTPASATCQTCSRSVCNTCVVFESSGAARCPACSSAATAGAGSIAWERRTELGPMTAFVETLKQLATGPQHAFRPPLVRPSLGSALFFALICHALGATAMLFVELAIHLVTVGPDAALHLEGRSVIGVLLSPLQAVFMMFLWAGLVHVALLVLGAGRGGFEVTARVAGYAAAAALFVAVPVVGPVLVLAGNLVLQVIGLASAHQIRYRRAAAAVLLPLVLCCGAFAAVAVPAFVAYMKRAG